MVKKVDSTVLQSILKKTTDNFSCFFKKQHDVSRFKSKDNKIQSYTTKQTNGSIAIVGNCGMLLVNYVSVVDSGTKTLKI